MKSVDLSLYKAMRLELIEELERGDIDKEAFIKANASIYEDRVISEPQTIDSLDLGIFYYQYYNTMAKYNQIQYRQLKYKDPFVAVEHRKKSEKLYKVKERVTCRLLKSLKDHRVEAYYVKSESKKLKHKLVEIVMLDEEKVVFHTLDMNVVHILKDKKWLSKGVRPSIIDSYINKPYYSVR